MDFYNTSLVAVKFFYGFFSMMAHLRFFFLSLATYAFTHIPMVDDFTKACEISQAYDRPLVLLFTGSDWCHWSQKILSEVFRTKAFEEEIGKQFIFLNVDFPELNLKGEKLLTQHDGLKERFHVDTFPTLVMIDSQGDEITRLTYTSEDPSQFAIHLQTLFLDYLGLRRECEKIDFSSTPIGDIESLYQRASLLQCSILADKLLEEGLAKDEGTFFLLEKYTKCLNSSEGSSQEAIEIKEKLKERDPENQFGTRLRLALLDFQENKESSDPDQAVEPLGTYIANFGKGDTENLGRLHRIISDYFAQHDRPDEAKEHAKKSIREVTNKGVSKNE